VVGQGITMTLHEQVVEHWKQYRAEKRRVEDELDAKYRDRLRELQAQCELHDWSYRTKNEVDLDGYDGEVVGWYRKCRQCWTSEELTKEEYDSATKD
jgi:hypothetical protein